MKSFKEYLIESKVTYEFKIKLAGDHDGCTDKIKEALKQFNVESCSEEKRTPIQETQADFPDKQNISVTTCSVCCAYPVTSQQITKLVSEAMGIEECCVKVRSPGEVLEDEINHQHDEKSGQTLLGTDYPKENNQDIVGEKQKMNLLKDLNKTKHQGELYKGVNDKLLAKKAPVEKGPAAKAVSTSSMSPIGSRQIALPQAKTGKN